ncbi:MAG: DUF6544 family protein, partial [Saprospiraceae bacterium]|nr:DUF6544 family protein [Saprospiraceae bacterium]
TWFGTFPNLIMLGAIMISYGNFTFDRLVQRETDVILSATTTIAGDTLLEQDIVHLPTCVRRWLRQSNAIGKPVICVGRIEQRALIKLKPEQEEWHQARAVQFTTTEVPAFIWTVDVDVNALVAFRGRDTYIDGKGNMLITLHSLLRIVNETGEKLDEGTLQRYLGEMVWFPSLAVSPYISWDRIDTYSARATMTYRGITGSGTFTFNDQGDFVAFSAMRYKDNTPTAQRYPWVLTVEAYETFEGRRIPSALQATWQLEDGDWTWLKLHLTKVSYNENALQYREQ